MTIDALKQFCLDLPSATWDFPFDDETVVFRVGNRIFALCGIRARPLTVNLKCEPGLARDLRASYPVIVPGWHMNKEHWNTVNLEAGLDDGFIEGLIRHSYDRVREGFPKAARLALGPNSLPN